MNLSPLLERAGPYLRTEWHESQSAWKTTPAPGPFITISRQAGSGGASLARLLARRLNAHAEPDETWRVYEGNLMTRMLQDQHLPARVARYLPEDRIPEIHASIGELVGLHPNLWELLQKSNATMRRLAAEGRVILVGRGANFATADLPRALHVRLVAPESHRAHYLAELYNITFAEALQENARCDAARRRYVKTVFNADVSDPAAYDLTLNTATTDLATAAELICQRIRGRVGLGATPR